MHDPSPQTLIVVQWALTGVCTLAVAARLGVRVWRQTWSFWVSDLLLVLSVLSYIATSLVVMMPFWRVTVGSLSNDQLQADAKMYYSASSIFQASLYLPRLSILAFYYVLFPAALTWLRVCLHVSTAFVTICFLACVFLDLFWCGADVSRGWRVDDADNCSLTNSPTNLLVNWAIGFASELLVFPLPLPLLKELKSLQKREKAGLLTLLMLGLITIAVSCARIGVATYYFRSTLTYIIENIETSTQILVVTLPALRPLLGVVKKKVGLFEVQSTFNKNSHKQSASTIAPPI